ncbi:MAG: hypothetical protein AB7G75_19010 [Candidatus Binatia bacterium]
MMTCRILVISSRAILTRTDGITMLVVLLVLMSLSVAGLFGAYKTQTELRIAHNDLRTKQALAAAEAGINHAFALIVMDAADGFNDELSNGGIGGGLSSLGSSVTIDGVNYVTHQFGNTSDDIYAVRVVDNFDETSGANNPSTDTDQKIKIIAIGRVGGAERMLEVMVEGDSPFKHMLFGKKFVTLSGGSVSDSFDCNLGSYGGTNVSNEGHVRSNGDITLSSGSTQVRGDATAGKEVKPSGGATVVGNTTENAPPLVFPLVDPCGPPYSGMSGISWTGDGSYNAATGELKGSSGANIVLADGTYCFSKITLSGSSTLTVNGPVEIHLTSKSTLSGGGIQNTSQLASNLRIYSSGDEIALSSGSSAYMAIYAPEAKITFSGGSDFYGAIIGLSITNSGGTQMHYDKCLQTLPGSSLKLTNWNDVRE